LNNLSPRAPKIDKLTALNNMPLLAGSLLVVWCVAAVDENVQAPVLNAFGRSVRTPNTKYRSVLGDPGERLSEV
jgi:hypothetical protein